jgi:zinc-ribbon domain
VASQKGCLSRDPRLRTPVAMAVVPSFCPTCGNQIPPGHTFCFKCGTRKVELTGAAPPPAPVRSFATPMATSLPMPPKSRTGPYLVLGVVVIVVVIVGSLAALGVFSPKTSPNADVITAVNFEPLTETSTCWPSSTGAGGTVIPGSNLTTTWTLSYKGGSSEPGACTVESVSVQTPGFSIVYANTPLVVNAEETQTLRIVLGTPTTGYVGTVSIDLNVVTVPLGIGDAFNAGNPVASVCGPGDTYASDGCVAGHYIYSLTVEFSVINFTSAEFEVKTSSGAIATATGAGGFSLVTTSGAPGAESATESTTMAMTSPFTVFSANATACHGRACTTSTPLTSYYTIVIDMGTSSPSGLGYTFVAVGIGSYDGTTYPAVLP